MAIGENNKHDCKISNSVKRIFNNICVVSDCCAISSSKMKNSLTQINYTYLQMKKPKIGKHKGFYNSLFDEINEKSGKVRFKNFRSRNRKDQAQESSSKFRENTISCLQHFYSFQNIGIWDLKTRNVGKYSQLSHNKFKQNENLTIKHHCILDDILKLNSSCFKNEKHDFVRIKIAKSFRSLNIKELLSKNTKSFDLGDYKINMKTFAKRKNSEVTIHHRNINNCKITQTLLYPKYPSKFQTTNHIYSPLECKENSNKEFVFSPRNNECITFNYYMKEKDIPKESKQLYKYNEIFKYCSKKGRLFSDVILKNKKLPLSKSHPLVYKIKCVKSSKLTIKNYGIRDIVQEAMKNTSDNKSLQIGSPMSLKDNNIFEKTADFSKLYLSIISMNFNKYNTHQRTSNITNKKSVTNILSKTTSKYNHEKLFRMSLFNLRNSCLSSRLFNGMVYPKNECQTKHQNNRVLQNNDNKLYNYEIKRQCIEKDHCQNTTMSSLNIQELIWEKSTSFNRVSKAEQVRENIEGHSDIDDLVIGAGVSSRKVKKKYIQKLNYEIKSDSNLLLLAKYDSNTLIKYRKTLHYVPTVIANKTNIEDTVRFTNDSAIIKDKNVVIIKNSNYLHSSDFAFSSKVPTSRSESYVEGDIQMKSNRRIKLNSYSVLNFSNDADCIPCTVKASKNIFAILEEVVKKNIDASVVPLPGKYDGTFDCHYKPNISVIHLLSKCENNNNVVCNQHKCNSWSKLNTCRSTDLVLNPHYSSMMNRVDAKIMFDSICYLNLNSLIDLNTSSTYMNNMVGGIQHTKDNYADNIRTRTSLIIYVASEQFSSSKLCKIKNITVPVSNCRDIEKPVFENETNFTFEGNNITYNIERAEQEIFCETNDMQKYIFSIGSTTACSEIKQLDKEEIHSKLYRVMNNGAICKKNTTIKILKPKFSGYASNFWRANNNSQKKPEPANDFEIEKVLFAKTELSSKDSTQQSNSVISESRIYTIQKAKVYKKTLECDNGLQFDYKYRNYQYSNSLINERRFLNNSEGYASNFWRANNNSQKKPEPANDFEIEKVLFAKTELSSKDSTQQSNSVISESRIYTIQKAKVYKKTLECDNGLQFDYKYRNYQYSNSLINERRFLNNSEGSARSFWKLLETGDDYKMEKILFAKNELSSKNICQQSTTFDNSSEIKNRGINTIQKKVSIKKVEECGSELQFLNKFPNYQHNNSLLKERCFLNKYERGGWRHMKKFK
ncbi:uncharacterized protein LOC105220101 isoform X5 [Zeugodacus cucurbitae]|uniref:uncharacterized protein LOC105220101 isoform X5 n=1 Tax=Zeugodacus cucurbitae TaxID=28588 RepID=UPI0023D92CC5|nr:uncharacterized protein LOC105220101 isoform X5 [Zeugodacus cucurbitae]